MLSPAVYRRIYRTALASPGGIFVEVGTFRGAATVSLALGLQHSKRRGRVISFLRDGSFIDQIRSSFRHFGVDELIHLVVGDITRTASAVPSEASISLLMHDADGHIDRDFALFLDRLIPDGPIIIDDCADNVRLKRRARGCYNVDAKRRLTFLLINYFKRKGVLSSGELVGATYFGHKQCGSELKIDLEEVLAVYRTLALQPLKRLARLAHQF